MLDWFRRHQREQLPKIVPGSIALPFDRPTAILAATGTSRRLFGRALVQVIYEFGEPRCYDLAELQAMVSRAVRNDPDDLWSQRASHEEVLDAIQQARSFLDLVTVVSSVR